MDEIKSYLVNRNCDVDEILENIDVIECLLDLANVPREYILRVLVAYIVVVTGTDEEQEALYVANHTDI